MPDVDPANGVVYPLFVQDAISSNQVLISASLRFNDILDAETLRASLSRLLTIGHWQKLAGRLHKRANGRLVLQVPKTFKSECPDVAFVSKTYDEEIDNHSLGKLYPKSTQVASTQPLEKSIRPLLVPPGFPATFDELATKRWPQLTLFVSSFNDATIVSILWPHTLLDASAFRSLLKNWSLVLAGREDQVETVRTFWIIIACRGGA
ncbi:hypothetical protein NQ176_g4118 [Zarea fungicola]|uniref:Uncharacterized protein n=1 Tax=Zarea fungicola TaxID=93591 RepID=A0ACC1NFY3_9HYPO|nr:hypothetical protein NQ176_g4118 [Lecanicillium fungicola]